tara:strand:- start:6303 stop:7703 length:1401 start_codon:yes stop_codon:yes gene_type:complete
MRLSKGSLNFGILASGTIFAQFLLLIASPFLTRLYSPSDFGLLAIFLSVSTISSVFFTLRYDMSIPITETKNESGAAFILCFVIATFFLALFCIAIYLLESFLERKFGLKNEALYYLVPVLAYFIALNKSLIMLPIREAHYKSVAKAKVSQSILVVSYQIIMSGFGFVSLLIANAAGCISSIFSLRQYLKDSFKSRANFNDLIKSGHKFKAFPLYSLWSNLQSVVGLQLPALLYGFYFGASFVGFYALAHRVIAAPISVLGEAVSKYFLSESVGQNSGKKLKVNVLDTHLSLLRLSLPFFIMVAVIGEYIFNVVFGEDWAVSAHIAKLMIPWMLLVFTVSPLSIVYEITNNQKVGLAFNTLLFFCRLGIVIAGGFAGEPIFTVLAYSLVSAAIWAALLLWTFNHLLINFKEVLPDYFKAILFSALTCAPSIIYKVTDYSQVLLLLLQPIFFSVYYYLFIRKRLTAK